jgi:predicted GNAT family acetyltransferase
MQSPALQTMPTRVTPLTSGSEQPVLSTLSPDSLTSVIMAGFIRDHGFTSPLNRGQFYACRGDANRLEGIALIGHTILFESLTDGAVQAFASLARAETSCRLLMGEQQAVKRFWNYYADNQQAPRLVCPIVFLERRAPFQETSEVADLRPATTEDLEHVVQAQASMAYEISGVDPLKKDPAGFRERYLRRIEKQRVWVLIREGRLIFKTDVLADTPQASYIEGVYVTPDERGKGLGRGCLISLARILLERAKAVYLFVEDKNTRTISFYSNLGFRVAGQYSLVYF